MNRYLLTFTMGACTLLLAAQTHAQLTITDAGRFDFTDTSGSGARELSGIAYTGSSSYYAVGDKDRLLQTLSISHDSTTGAITTASINPSPILMDFPYPIGGPDHEAIAVQGSNILLVSENGPELESIDPITGLPTGPLNIINFPSISSVYNLGSRPNRSLESLTVYPANTSTFLTANEDALTLDGPTASFTAGAVVRIQAASFDTTNSSASAIGQFAYPIDAINGDIPLASGEQSGLVELLTLPDNTVIAMERAVGATGYRIRLYEIHGDSATDVSGFSQLSVATPGVDYTPLSKTLLWENTFSVLTNSNFEGITLGPTLTGGEQSLILVADNASGPVLPFVGQQWTAEDQSLYSLHIKDINPACSGPNGCLAADLSQDGFVGIADLNIILARWNQVVFPGSAADPSVDGFVGIDDLNVVLGNWNAGTPPTGLATIPEPASAAVLGLLSIVLAKRTPATRHR